MCLYGQIKLTLYQNRGGLSRLMFCLALQRQGLVGIHQFRVCWPIKYSFARDLQWYAWLNSIYHAEMHELEETDTDLLQAFLDGDFAVQKSQIPFKYLLNDQALEKEIKVLKHGGLTGAAPRKMKPF